ncbi:MAG: ribonuclease D, partial [Syntrophaceae bacterium]|nr:ribonuclease D [Syntrophaceae bacterium]
ALAEAERAVGSTVFVAIDTEYDSFRYFHDKLCLIQIQTGERAWLIDPLAGLDLAFLGQVLAEPAILKIFHAGDNDIRILKRDYAFSFRNIFDTHRAADLLGYRRLALATLLEETLGIVLAKKMQRSRWDLRPLTKEQLDYAALDVAHLPELCRKLEQELREKNQDAEATRLFAEMTEVLWREKTLDRMAHRRAPGYAQLTAAQKSRLHNLFQWRFEKGRELNRAPFMVLPDRQLTVLAALETPTLAAAVRSLLIPDKSQRYTEELAALLAAD